MQLQHSIENQTANAGEAAVAAVALAVLATGGRTVLVVQIDWV